MRTLGVFLPPLAIVVKAAFEQEDTLMRLEPASVWKHFNALCNLNRCSGHEAQVADYVRSVADAEGVEWLTDSVGNLVVRRPGSGGGAAAEPIIVQTQMDMACDGEQEAAGLSRGLQPVELKLREDGWAVAEKSRMGADSGVGIAVALALLDEPSDAFLPPLELLFTVQGQSDRLGAHSLNTSMLAGRHLINLDAAEHGVLFAGAAGHSRVKIRLPVSYVPLRAESHNFVLTLRGLRGGHSGDEIYLGSANALVGVARAAAALRAELPGLQLIGIEGGSVDMAIPSEAMAGFAMPLSSLHHAREVVLAVEAGLRAEHRRTDPQLHLRFEQPEHAVDNALSEESAERLLDLLLLLPNGVVRQSAEIPGSIETSNNIARVRQVQTPDAGHLEVLCLARSAMPSMLADLRMRIARISQRVVATATAGASYPCWAPNRSSSLLSIAQEAFRRVEGRVATLAMVHDDLEVAAILEKMPHLDAVAFGPDVQGSSSPGECVKIDSVEKTWALTRRVLARLAAAEAPDGAGASAGELPEEL